MEVFTVAFSPRPPVVWSHTLNSQIRKNCLRCTVQGSTSGENFFFLSLLHFHVVKQILILSGHASFSRNETDLIVKKILVDMIVKFSRFPSHKICGTHVLRAADSALCLWEIKLAVDPESSTVGREAARRAGEEWAAPAVLTTPPAPEGRLFLRQFTPFPSPVLGNCWCQATDKVVGVREKYGE